MALLNRILVKNGDIVNKFLLLPQYYVIHLYFFPTTFLWSWESSVWHNSSLFLKIKKVFIAKLIETNCHLFPLSHSMMWSVMADEAHNGGKSCLHKVNNGGSSLDNPYYTSSRSTITAIHSWRMGGLTCAKWLLFCIYWPTKGWLFSFLKNIFTQFLSFKNI